MHSCSGAIDGADSHHFTYFSTGFVRNVKRAEIDLDIDNTGSSKKGGRQSIDLSQVKRRSTAFPEEIKGEPQVILVKGDIIQISKQR
jgi:hypothetical protein